MLYFFRVIKAALFFVFLQFSAVAQINQFENVSVMGNLESPQAPFNKNNGEYLLSGKLAENATEDLNMVFYWKKVSGDFIFDFQIDKAPKKAKFGMGFAEALDTEKNLGGVLINGGIFEFYYGSDDFLSQNKKIAPNQYDLLRLERVNDEFIFSFAVIGGYFKEFERFRSSAPRDIYLGAALLPENTRRNEDFTFSKVRITTPKYSLRTDLKVRSNLEIMDLQSGTRTIIYSDTTHIEAPNWSPDGSFLVYNNNGRLYKLPVSGGSPEMIPSDFADKINTDHGISPDGRQIVISHYNGPKITPNNSVMYVMPITGGKPRQIVPDSPSYWHGWSPDGNTLAYVGKRAGIYNIYTVPISGGMEKQMTFEPSLDDGPNYSPDGKYIYFNSNRSEKMEIWRMNIDGTEPLQLTNDLYQNWFPHPSPDGKLLVFLSYPPETDPTEHPADKKVMLRLMNAKGGEPEVIAHLYGGQGSINAPSWSPDSKQFAFVSYSYFIE
ncbi:TolB family protein [Flexithrix dorotheae]|uniref:TolB family protein n=1 Tax=Flexithrix dorotheae TaxID=70993 RepID=UPI000369F71B|nr:TolB family protein [Flexithrix dorotheae]